MKKLLKSLFTFVAFSAALGFLAGCDHGTTPGRRPQTEDSTVEIEELKDADICWTEFEIPSKYLEVAKPGAKITFTVSSNTDKSDATYCKTYIMNESWDHCGIKAIFGPDSDTDCMGIENPSDVPTANRPYAEGEGTFYFYLNDEMLSQNKLIFSGCAKMSSCTIEYIGGKKEKESDPVEVEVPFEGAGFTLNEAKDTATYTLAIKPKTATAVQLVFQNKQLPTTTDEGKTLAEAGHDFTISGKFTLKLGDETIWDAEEKSFKLTNNAYGDDYQKKVNILSDKTLAGGSVITLSFTDLKVATTVAEDAKKITSITTTIIDDSEKADYWTDLCGTKIEDNVFWTGTCVSEAAAETVTLEGAQFTIGTEPKADDIETKLCIKYDSTPGKEPEGKVGEYDYSANDESSIITNLKLKVTVLKSGATSLDQAKTYTITADSASIAGALYSKGYEWYTSISSDPEDTVLLNEGDQVKIEVESASVTPADNASRINIVLVHVNSYTSDWIPATGLFADFGATE